MAEALAADPAELGRMGRAGAALAADRHDADAEAAKLAALIEGAAGPRRAEPQATPAPALAAG
jgi:hypothetical protein